MAFKSQIIKNMKGAIKLLFIEMVIANAMIKNQEIKQLKISTSNKH